MPFRHHIRVARSSIEAPVAYKVQFPLSLAWRLARLPWVGQCAFRWLEVTGPERLPDYDYLAATHGRCHTRPTEYFSGCYVPQAIPGGSCGNSEPSLGVCRPHSGLDPDAREGGRK